MATYDVGALVKLSATYVNEAGRALDPDQVFLQVKFPNGTIQTFVYGVDPIVRDGVGAYHYEVSASVAGTFYYRWYSTGAGQAARETFFAVNRSQFA